MQVNGQVTRLKEIIYEFDELSWGKLKGTTAMANFIVNERGFCPSNQTAKLQTGILKAIEMLRDSIDEEYQIAEESDIKSVITYLNNLLKLAQWI